MIFITSIAPTHTNGDIQVVCTESWSKFGKVYSLNTASEIKLLKDKYKHVTFVETNQTMEAYYGKPYVSLNALMSFAIESKEEHICLINSDIELRCNAEFIERIKDKMTDNILMCNRFNYGGIEKIFYEGIDVFFIHKNFLPLFKQSNYALGQCHFDYWIPYRAANSGVQCVFIAQKIAFHKDHKQRFDNEMWVKTGRYFRWQNGLHKFSETVQGIGQMSKYVYDFIYNFASRENI